MCLVFSQLHVCFTEDIIQTYRWCLSFWCMFHRRGYNVGMLTTRRWHVPLSPQGQANHIANDTLDDAVMALKQGQVVAFPTETVYGLGGDATNDDAIRRIYAAKGRPSDNPLIIHVGDVKQVAGLVEQVPLVAKELMRSFWPGPLTLVMKRKAGVLSSLALAGDTVGIRIPNHPTALALLKQCGLPIAAPSANKSGRPSPTRAEHVLEDLDGVIAGVIDSGATGIGVESTVVDCTTCDAMAGRGMWKVDVLRPGGVTRDDIRTVLGPGSVLFRRDCDIEDACLNAHSTDNNGCGDMVSNPPSASSIAPRAPGMKYAHYAPKAPLYLVRGDVAFMQLQIRQFQTAGKTVGVIITEEHESGITSDVIRVCGRRSDLAAVAANLFHVVRSFDGDGGVVVDVILCEWFDDHDEGMGEAIMNRLKKAAAGKVIDQSSV